jgi:hypothetical protein
MPVGTSRRHVLRDLYQSIGMRVTVRGPSHVYWGEDRVPIQSVPADENTGLLTRLAESGQLSPFA